jgi:hypothetical protein
MNAEQAKLVIELGLMCEFFRGRDVRPGWRGTLSGMDAEGCWDEDVWRSYDRCRIMPGMQVVKVPDRCVEHYRGGFLAEKLSSSPPLGPALVAELKAAGIACQRLAIFVLGDVLYAVIQFEGKP